MTDTVGWSSVMNLCSSCRYTYLRRTGGTPQTTHVYTHTHTHNTYLVPYYALFVRAAQVGGYPGAVGAGGSIKVSLPRPQTVLRNLCFGKQPGGSRAVLPCRRVTAAAGDRKQVHAR